MAPTGARRERSRSYAPLVGGVACLFVLHLLLRLMNPYSASHQHQDHDQQPQPQPQQQVLEQQLPPQSPTAPALPPRPPPPPLPPQPLYSGGCSTSGAGSCTTPDARCFVGSCLSTTQTPPATGRSHQHHPCAAFNSKQREAALAACAATLRLARAKSSSSLKGAMGEATRADGPCGTVLADLDACSYYDESTGIAEVSASRHALAQSFELSVWHQHSRRGGPGTKGIADREDDHGEFVVRPWTDTGSSGPASPTSSTSSTSLHAGDHH